MQNSGLIKSDISEYLRRHEEKDMLRFLTAGSVDDGKSTLIGRLLYDSHMIYEDQLVSVLQDSKVHGTTGGDFDPALLTDGLRAEREQGITIDVAYRYFSTDKRSFIICDAPGHEQYTRNMATGASRCNLAVILIDARKGVLPQTRRHSFIASLLGIRHFVIAINKMDAVAYSEDVFRQICSDYRGFAAKLEVADIHFLPISALRSDNVVNRSENMPWFQGEPLLSYLETVEISTDRNFIDFRFPVQGVIRTPEFRGVTGTMASGIVRKGDEVEVLPSGMRSRIKSIVTYDGELEEAFASMAVTLTMEDEIDISRGSMLSKPGNVPEVNDHFEAMLVWMDKASLTTGRQYVLKSATQTVPCTVEKLQYKYDINTLKRVKAAADTDDFSLSLNDIGRLRLHLHRPLCFDAYARNRQTGSFILIDPLSNATAGAGMILQQTPDTHIERHAGREPVSQNITWENTAVTVEERQRLFGHSPATVWLTGLSGSGKSTIAKALEKLLITRGVKAYVLDGDNIRHGLNKDLGFAPQDRSENIRRIAEVAKLMNDAGLVVVTAFISPYISDRQAARDVIGDHFVEVFVNAPLEVCEQRDPKGLYKKARAGEIRNFTGIDAPYEIPAEPELTVETAELSVQEIVTEIVQVLK